MPGIITSSSTRSGFSFATWARRLLAAGRGADLVALHRQQVPQQLDVLRRVVDHQDFRLGHFLSTRRFTVSRNSFRLIGLPRKASKPAAAIALRSVGRHRSGERHDRDAFGRSRRRGSGGKASMPLMPGS
jgi:hypothetical protein